MNVEKQENLSVRKINEEFFVLDRKNSGIHTFNQVGSLIWEKLEPVSDLSDIVKVVMEQFEIDEKTAREDAIEFIEALEKKGLLTVSELD